MGTKGYMAPEMAKLLNQVRFACVGVSALLCAAAAADAASRELYVLLLVVLSAAPTARGRVRLRPTSVEVL